MPHLSYAIGDLTSYMMGIINKQAIMMAVI